MKIAGTAHVRPEVIILNYCPNYLSEMCLVYLNEPSRGDSSFEYRQHIF